jgi:hypothetical protein
MMTRQQKQKKKLQILKYIEGKCQVDHNEKKQKGLMEAYHICNHKVKLFDKVLPPFLILCSSLAN